MGQNATDRSVRRLGARVSLIGLIAGSLAASTFALPAQAAPSDVLFVAANGASPTPGEAAVIDRLGAQGHDVETISDETLTASAAVAHDLIVISSRVSTSLIDDAVLDAPVPILVAKPWLLDDVGLAPSPRGNYGSTVVSAVDIVDPTHPAAAGLSGSVQMGDGSTRVSWITATPAASVVATVGAGATIAVLAPGDARSDGTPAPACRVAFPIFANEPVSYSADAWSMFDATIAHALDDCGDTAPPPPPPADGPEVVLVSIDGLRSSVLDELPASDIPSWTRLRADGASTLDARTVFDQTRTMPNHTSMFTGRPVVGPQGHGVNFNNDDGVLTVHDTAGEYAASIFDVVHDAGLATSLYASKEKFEIFERTWNATNGAPDTTGPDNGRDKIDTWVRTSPAAIMTQARTELADAASALTVIHLSTPDIAGHASGWDSPAYLDAVRLVDGLVGDLMDTIEADPDLVDATLIVTTDHGGSMTGHFDASILAHHTIPFAVWGSGVAPGADLYALNSRRQAPGSARPDYTGPQPIRNADAANLALDLLGLTSVPGSAINSPNDLVLDGDPPPPADSSMLFVAGDAAALRPGEAAVVSRLEAAGNVVTTVSDDVVTAAAAIVHDLVVIGADVTSSRVDRDVFEIAVPLLVAKPWLFDEAGITPPASGNYGSTSNSGVDIAVPGHPAVAGLSGDVVFGDGSTRLSWGNAVPTATVFATVGSRDTIFTVEAGAARADGTPAPACRATFPIFKNEPTTYTAAAWSMFDSMIDHALANCVGA